MENNLTDNSTKAGTAGGTLLVLLLNINSGEIIKTAVLSATGAVVSFSVSLLLKKLLRRIREWF
jgi:mannitol-specific phosphotransferase system IIBC component